MASSAAPAGSPRGSLVLEQRCWTHSRACVELVAGASQQTCARPWASEHFAQLLFVFFARYVPRVPLHGRHSGRVSSLSSQVKERARSPAIVHSRARQSQICVCSSTAAAREWLSSSRLRSGRRKSARARCVLMGNDDEIQLIGTGGVDGARLLARPRCRQLLSCGGSGRDSCLLARLRARECEPETWTIFPIQTI